MSCIHFDRIAQDENRKNYVGSALQASVVTSESWKRKSKDYVVSCSTIDNTWELHIAHKNARNWLADKDWKKREMSFILSWIWRKYSNAA